MAGERERGRRWEGREGGKEREGGVLCFPLKIAGIHKSLHVDTNSRTHLVGNKPRNVLRQCLVQIIIIPGPLENAQTDPTHTHPTHTHTHWHAVNCPGGRLIDPAQPDTT